MKLVLRYDKILTQPNKFFTTQLSIQTNFPLFAYDDRKISCTTTKKQY